jgi:hypothetical protein
MKATPLFTIGSDVEFFARKDGKYVSAIPFIGNEVDGTKHNPIVFPDGSTLQRDNVAAEFATAVANSAQKFIGNMHVAVHHLIKELNKFKAEPVASASVVFPDSELDHWEAHEFGCDPDFNAWDNGGVNPKPCAVNSNLRTAALHVHVGKRNLKSKKNKIRMVQLMDAVHGIISTLVDIQPESLRRKELYGKAGAFRPTSYGVEYRVLSNFFASSPRFSRFVYSLTNDVIKIFDRDEDEKLIKMMGGRRVIVDVINTGDSSVARHLVYKYLGDFLSVDSTDTLMSLMQYTPKSMKEEWNG